MVASFKLKSAKDPFRYPGRAGDACDFLPPVVLETLQMTDGMSYQVSDFGEAAYRSFTKTGAKLLIVN